jgi:hypothetical protein
MMAGNGNSMEERLKAMKLETLRDCLDICVANNDEASASEISSWIYAIEHPDFKS